MNRGHLWSEDEIRLLASAYSEKPLDISDRQFSLIWSKQHPDITDNAIRGQLSRIRADKKYAKSIVQTSPYPVFDEPLVMEGDALVLPDLEIPFHHADFVNRCLDLAGKWGIRQAILAGDVLHFDSLSGWEPNWVTKDDGGLTADAEAALMEFAKTLPAKQQGAMFGLLGDLGQRTETDGLSTELGIARQALRALAEHFDRIDHVLGNHEGRFIRTMGTVLDPEEVKRLISTGDNWRIAPYYFSYLDTVHGRYIISHPKNAAKFSASRLCSKYLAHVLMAHSHQLNFTYDPSGKYYAIEIGCGVDEQRLAYVSQRQNTSPTHILGACIIRGGYPHLLHKNTDWKFMEGR